MWSPGCCSRPAATSSIRSSSATCSPTTRPACSSCACTSTRRPRSATPRRCSHCASRCARGFGMQTQVHSLARRPRLLMLVSKHGHCLNDLLFRCRSGQLNAEIAGRRLEPPRLRRAEREPRRAVPPPAVRGARQARAGAAASKRWSTSCRSTSSCSRATCRSSARVLRLPRWARHQHPSQLPAELQGREAVLPGARARREADRREPRTT